MGIETDLNVPPYFNDYDESKRYHALIHRPHTAIQARELSQAYSIIQTQIERFGNHIFKDGSIVDGIGILYYPNTHYISIEDSFNLEANALPTEYDGSYLITNSTDSNNAVRAVIKIAKTGTKLLYPNTNRFYLNYIYTGTDLSNNDVNLFKPGDTLYLYSNVQNKFSILDANNLINSVYTLNSNSTFTSNGFAYLIGCTDGTIFQKGYFIKVPSQTITIQDYSTNVYNHIVGFNTKEEIITEFNDPTLFDNALGYDNENAPGAHRLKLTPTLTAKLKTDTANNTNFCTIVEFDGNEPTQQKDDPQYSIIEKEIARNKYEESGDYVTIPFNVETRVHESNTQLFTYEISSGIAYVRGYRIEKVSTTKIDAPRASDTEIAQNQIITGNFGNYIIANELVGFFDHNNIAEVALYDTPQYSISEYEGRSTLPTGSVVGYANIRSINYNQGVKGLPSAQYLVYLQNIRMNANKSFATDAKSIYVSGAKADIVLEKGVASIKESNKKSLIFNTGLNAIKRLTGNTGIGDTSYVYLQNKTATLSTTGNTTITINLPATGGNEKLNSTTGTTITGTLLGDYNVYLSNSAYTANLSGTVELSSGNNILIGVSTFFSTELAVNSNIRIYANTTQTYVRRVKEIISNTYIVLDTSIPVTNNFCQFGQYYVEGTPLPLQSVHIDSNAQFTAVLGKTLASGTQTVTCTYPVYRYEAQAIPKVINKNVFVKIDTANNVANTVGPWDLGLIDVHKIRNIYVSNSSYSNTNPNRLLWFEFDNGQRDDFYDTGKILVKPQYATNISNTDKILVELDHFTANLINSVGFFSIDSYPIDDVNASNTNAIQTIEMPEFSRVDMRNLIDFRVRKNNTANNSTTIAGASINPVVSNSSFLIGASGQYLIYPDTNFTADVEFYLPRKDLITLDSIGEFNVILGRSAQNPPTPFVQRDQSIIAECFIPPYPSPTTREFETFKTNLIKIRLRTNRRYTMKDIAAIEERVKRIEYYTVLSLLEQQAKDLTIPDTDGLNRFKNGIFADPFMNHSIGNSLDIEYNISIDKEETVARPFFVKHDLDFILDNANSSNITVSGPIVTLNFDSEIFINQRFATKYRNTTESIWQWNGIITLFPSFDFFRDDDRAASVNFGVNTSSGLEALAASPAGRTYGDWRDIITNTITLEGETQLFDTPAVGFGFGDAAGLVLAVAAGVTPLAASRDTTVITSTLQNQTVTQLQVSSTSSTTNLGTFVSDVFINPYLRSRVVGFRATNMKPNTTVHAFFDGVNVDEHCAPGEVASGNLANINTIGAFAGREENAITRTGFWATTLVTDSTGTVNGVFTIPPSTFRTGERVFELTNVDNLVIGEDAKITTSKAIYSGENYSVTKKDLTMTVTTPVVSFAETTNSRTLVNTQILHEDGFWDPIAESFTIKGIRENIPGIFLSKVGVYFQSKDTSLGINVFICEMINGFPNASSIIGQGHLRSSDVVISNNATQETVFTLDFPTYLLNNVDYSFIIQPDGNSPEYNLWVSETGDFDISSGEQAYTNPYTGIMFISANRKTWTPIQKEDIKFNLYRAKFTPLNGTVLFNNENDEFLIINGFTKANSEFAVNIGDLVLPVNNSIITFDNSTIASNTIINKHSGKIQYINESTGELWLDSSTAIGANVFTSNSIIAVYRLPQEGNTLQVNTSTLIAYANIVSVDNLPYHAVVPKFDVLQPVKTGLQYKYKGYSNTNIVDTAYMDVVNNREYEYLDVERHIMSRSNEIANNSSNKTGTFSIDLSSGSEYLSPAINLSQKVGLFIQNKINNDLTNEHTRYGNSMSKYISKKVLLADGQEAEDLKVFIAAYRPVGTDVSVYAKVWNNQDPEIFNDKIWSKMEISGNGFVYSSTSDKKNFIEYEYIMPSINVYAKEAYTNTGVSTYNPLSGGVTIAQNSTVINAKEHTFNSNTAVNSAADTITLSNANTYFSAQDPVMYKVFSGNTAIGGLISNTKYYVSFSNSTCLALSSTKTGSNVNITASNISETGHALTGTLFLDDFDVGDRIKIVDNNYNAIRTITSISNNTVLNVDLGLESSNSAALYYVFKQTPGDGVVEYYDSFGSKYIGFKMFAIKIVLTSQNPVLVPRINDVRAIALQV